MTSLALVERPYFFFELIFLMTALRDRIVGLVRRTELVEFVYFLGDSGVLISIGAPFDELGKEMKKWKSAVSQKEIY